MEGTACGSDLLPSQPCCHRAIKPQTPSHSLGAGGRRDKIQTIPLTEDHVMENSFILVQAVYLAAICARGHTRFHFIRVPVAEKQPPFLSHVLCTGKISIPASFPYVKSGDAAPPLYVTEQLALRRLVCSTAE